MAIVIFHAGSFFGLPLINGGVAVEIFFILSGFMMSLVLNEKYIGAKSYKLFISNRFLRIYPAYLFILLLTVAFMAILFYWHKELLVNNASFISTNLLSYTDQLKTASFNYPASILALLSVTITNIIIYGQDYLIVLDLYFSWKYYGLLIPQAWALGMEMMFYPIAPFIVRRKLAILLGIFGIGVISRLLIIFKGPPALVDGYVYFFFIPELAFFMLGCISYKIYLALKGGKFNRQILVSVSIMVLGSTIFFGFIPIPETLKRGAYYGLVTLAIPFMFIQSNGSKIDKMLADISYCIYISHILIISILQAMGFKGNYLTIFSVFVTVIFSIFLLAVIVNPIEKFRQKRTFKTP